MIRTVHIRTRQPRGHRDKTSWLANGGADPTTFCGADPTDVDVGWRDKNERWTRDDGVEFIPCEACIAVRVKGDK